MSVPSTDRKKRKVYHHAAKGQYQGKSLNLHTNMNYPNYINTFNLYITRLKDHEYKPKHPELYTWSQDLKHLNKLKMVEFLVRNDQERRSRKEVTERKVTRSNSEFIPSSHKGSLDLNSSALNKFRGKAKLIKALVLTSKPKNGTPENKPAKKERSSVPLSQAVENNYTESLLELSRIDQSMQRHQTRPVSISKLQTTMLLQKHNSVPSIQNLQHMQNQFDRKNAKINRILSQINLKEELLDKQQMEQETFRKIQLATKDFKLHQFLRPKSHTSRHNSPERNQEAPASARIPTQGSHASGRTVLPRIQDTINQNLSNREKTDNDREHSMTPERNARFSIKSSCDIDRTMLIKLKKKAIISHEKPRSKSLVKNLDLAITKLNKTMNISSVTQGESTITLGGHVKINNILKQTMTPEKATRVNLGTSKRRKESAESDHNQNSQSTTPRRSTSRGSASPVNVGRNQGVSHHQEPRTSIFNYKAYTKKKYLEKAVNFEVSKDLKCKLKGLDKDVQKSAKNVLNL